MRKINENEFVNFTIKGNGWNMTMFSFKDILAQWSKLTGPGLNLLGLKKNGDSAIIDSK